MTNLTENQKKTLAYIQFHIETTGIPPTLREIAAHFKWKAVGSAQDVVAALRKKGLIHMSSAGKARQIIPSQLIGEQKSKAKNSQNSESAFENFFKVPLLGYVQAGLPMEAIAQPSDYILFPNFSPPKSRSSNFFALKIEGFSMVNAGFLPGDFILVESTSMARDKEIVVALVNYSEVTVKRFAHKNSDLYHLAQKESKEALLPPAFLVAENPEFKPIVFGIEKEDKIIGIVRSLFRKNVNGDF